MIKALLFDVDGVLLIGDAWSKDLPDDYGITGEMLRPFFRGPFQACLIGKADLKTELIPYLARWNWPLTVEEFVDYWFRHYELNEQMLQDIQQLRRQGFACYLATQQERYRLAYILHTLGFAHLFDGCFCSTDHGYMKRDHSFFEAALATLPDYLPAEILFWDDTPDNITTARDTGIQAELYQDIAHFRLTLQTYTRI